MHGQAVTRKLDSVLLPFVEAVDETESTHLLIELISRHAEPLIREIIGYKLRTSFNSTGRSRHNQDAEDVYSEVILQLFARLRELKLNPNNAIGDFRSYVATTAYHACDKYLRQKYPQRWRLKNRLQYLLTHHPAFAVWESRDNRLLCGLAEWCDGSQATQDIIVITSHNGRLQRLLESPQAFEAARLDGRTARSLKAEDLLKAIFEWVEQPVGLEDMVAVMASLWGIKDQVLQVELDENQKEINSSIIALNHLQSDIGVEIDRRRNLERLWQEICQLPLPQRAALLLNLRDVQERSALTLFPLTGIATIRQIAEALAMSAEQLASLWNKLPLDDTTIAEYLGVRRQQVINLRKAARERLTRRMKKFN